MRTFYATLCMGGILFISTLASGITGPEYTGNLMPKPQEVIGQWQFIPVHSSLVTFRIDGNSFPAGPLARKFLTQRLSEIQAKEPGKVRPVEIILGTMDSEVIKEQSKAYALKLETRVLPPEGYVIRIRSDGDKIRIIGSGVDNRGTYYAAMSIFQQMGVEKGQAGIRLAEMTDWPMWSKRYAGDFNPHRPGALEYLTWYKINGYAVQHRREWKDFNPTAPQNWGRIGTYGEDFKLMKEWRDQYGLMDFMMIINIYAEPKGPFFNITSEKDVQGLIDRCKFAASNDFNHILIAADDYTPYDEKTQSYVCPHPEEKARFKTAGRAHAYLMRRVFDAVKKAYPEVEFSFVPPPYSTLDHAVPERIENQRYLRELCVGLPADISIAWTGPRVISSTITREDFLQYSKYVNGRRLMLWDNSDCVETPPKWVTTFYPELATDLNGRVFLENFALGWGWYKGKFALTANEYLWNPKGFDPDREDAEAFEKMFGKGRASILKAYLVPLRQLNDKNTPKDRRKELIKKVEQAVQKMKEMQIDTHYLSVPKE